MMRLRYLMFDAITFNEEKYSNSSLTDSLNTHFTTYNNQQKQHRKSYLFRTFIYVYIFSFYFLPSHRRFLNPNPNQNNSQSIHIIAVLIFYCTLLK